MRAVTPLLENDRWRLLLLLRGGVFLLLFALPAAAKVATDFDPNLDFSKYKTFAYIGGVENLVRMQMNPELTAKGLREVTPEKNPDLGVRDWGGTQVDSNV